MADPSQLKESSFRAVLDLVLAGDREARDELFTRLVNEKSEGALLIALARRLIPRGDRVRDLVDTRDFVQSALKSGWINLAEFQGSSPGEFLNWIRTIVRRKVSRAIRRELIPRACNCLTSSQRENRFS